MKRFHIFLDAHCLVLALLASLSLGLPASAFAAAGAATAAEASAMSEGDIVKVDPAAKKLTIRHGELKNLSMPPMTMLFRVGEPAMLEQVKAGDKVRFVAAMVNGALTVVAIEKAP